MNQLLFTIMENNAFYEFILKKAIDIGLLTSRNMKINRLVLLHSNSQVGSESCVAQERWRPICSRAYLKTPEKNDEKSRKFANGVRNGLSRSGSSWGFSLLFLSLEKYRGLWVICLSSSKNSVNKVTMQNIHRPIKSNNIRPCFTIE